jgi:hypothetical protein
MNSGEAILALKADPQAFLKKNIVSIFGGNAAIQSGVRHFWIQGHAGGTGHTSGLSGMIGRTKTRAGWKIVVATDNNRAIAPPDATWFEAYYVSMRKEGQNEGLNVTHFALPPAGGPNLMLTSQLSACTFGIGSATPGGSRLVTHIEQTIGDRSEASARLAQRNLATTGLIANPAFPGANGIGHVIEKGRPNLGMAGDYDTFASVIGLRSGGSWTFYMQKKRGMAGAYQLYDDPVVLN